MSIATRSARVLAVAAVMLGSIASAIAQQKNDSDWERLLPPTNLSSDAPSAPKPATAARGFATAAVASNPRVSDAKPNSYIVTRLTQFRDATAQRTTNAFIMHSVARTLDDESIQALAGWIGALPPGDAH